MGETLMFEYPPGATPLDLDEANGLLARHITTQNQLNEWEQINILAAEKWVNRQQFKAEATTNTEFAKQLHKRMFNNTWSWAGEFRRSNKNIGVDWQTISVELKVLFDNLRYQLENRSYEIDELVTRFHHRLVVIHPFANGNGRHARMMTDIVLLSQGCERFSWGSGNNIAQISPIRANYIAALHAADKRDYSPLIFFVRS